MRACRRHERPRVFSPRHEAVPSTRRVASGTPSMVLWHRRSGKPNWQMLFGWLFGRIHPGRGRPSDSASQPSWVQLSQVRHCRTVLSNEPSSPGLRSTTAVLLWNSPYGKTSARDLRCEGACGFSRRCCASASSCPPIEDRPLPRVPVRHHPLRPLRRRAENNARRCVNGLDLPQPPRPAVTMAASNSVFGRLSVLLNGYLRAGSDITNEQLQSLGKNGSQNCCRHESCGFRITKGMCLNGTGQPWGQGIAQR